MEEKLLKLRNYLNKQKETHKKWINEALKEDKSISALNSKLELIKDIDSYFNYLFGDELPQENIDEYNQD